LTACGSLARRGTPRSLQWRDGNVKGGERRATGDGHYTNRGSGTQANRAQPTHRSAIHQRREKSRCQSHGTTSPVYQDNLAAQPTSQKSGGSARDVTPSGQRTPPCVPAWAWTHLCSKFVRHKACEGLRSLITCTRALDTFQKPRISVKIAFSHGIQPGRRGCES